MTEEKGRTKTATEEEGEDLWAKVVELTQTAFREGKLAKEATWQAVVIMVRRPLERSSSGSRRSKRSCIAGYHPRERTSRWRYPEIQLRLLRRDPLERSSSGRRTSFRCGLVPTLHPPPRFPSVRRILL